MDGSNRRRILTIAAVLIVAALVIPVAYAYIAETINSGNNSDTKPMTLLIRDDPTDPDSLMEVALPIPTEITSESANGPWSFNDSYSKKITGYIYAQCPDGTGKMKVWVDMENMKSWSVVERITLSIYYDDLSRGSVTFQCDNTDEKTLVLNVRADAPNTYYTISADQNAGYSITGVDSGSTVINSSYNASMHTVTFQCSDTGLNSIAVKVKAEEGKTGKNLTLSAGSGYTIEGAGASSTVSYAAYNVGNQNITFRCNTTSGDVTEKILVVKVKANYGSEGKNLTLSAGSNYTITGLGAGSTTTASYNTSTKKITFNCADLNEKVIAVKVKPNSGKGSTDLTLSAGSGYTITGIGPVASTEFISYSDDKHVLTQNAKVGRQYILFGADSELLEVGGEPNRIEIDVNTLEAVEKGWEGKRFDIDVEYRSQINVNPRVIDDLLESRVVFVAADDEPIPSLSVKYCLGYKDGTIKDHNSDNSLIPLTYAYQGNVVNPPVSPKGYTITGWYIQQDSSTGQGTGEQWSFSENHLDPRSGKYPGSTWVGGNQLELYAKYQIVDYSIKFTWDGLTISGTWDKTYNVRSDNIDYTSMNGDVPKTDSTGKFNLKGWTGTGLSGTQANISIPKGSVGDRNYAAEWNYIVTFNKNDGSQTPETTTQTIPRGTYTALNKSPWTTIGNTDFYKWNTAANGSGEWYTDGQDVNNLGNTTLYAIWKDKCTVTYNKNGVVPTSTDPSPVTVVCGSTIALLDGSWTSTALCGWTTNADGTGTFYKLGGTMVVESSITLYAQSSDTTVTFKSNGGLGSDVIQNTNSTKAFPLNDNTFTAPAGMVFSNWNTNSAGTGASYNPGYKYTGSGTLFAIWNHTVTFDANGGTGAMAPQLFTDNVAITLNSNTFTRTGWVFDKWNTEADGSGTSYADGASVTFAANVTLYAVWKPSLIYYGNGSTGGTAPGTESYDVGTEVTVSNQGTLVKTNYAFMGWNTTVDGSGKTYAAGDKFVISSDTTLYAMWGRTITFKPNGGTESQYTQFVRENVPTVLMANEFTRSGFTFCGWNTNADGTGTTYADGSKITVTDNLDLYAIWGYTVAFDLAVCPSGFEAPDTQLIKSGSKAIEPDMGLDGYRVTWYSDKELTSKYVFSTPVTGNITLYAKWEVKIFLICNPLNGKDQQDKCEWAPYGESYTLTTKFVDSYYTQWGWNSNGMGRGPYFKCGESYAMAVPQALYAIWVDPSSPESPYQPMNFHFIIYCTNEGSGYMDKQRVPIAQATAKLNLIDSSHFYREGWAFDKWALRADGTGTLYADGAENVPVSDNLALFAIWKPCVTYDGNGNTGGTAPAKSAYAINDTVTVAGNTGSLTKAGYTFDGWNTKADGTGTTYAAGSTFTITEAVKLYALWKHTVTYDGNESTGGTVPVDDAKYADGATVTVKGNTGTLIKTGYTFDGWNTKADGSGITYAAGTGTFLISVDTVLYAKWIIPNP